VSQLASHSSEYTVVEGEPPEIEGRNLITGAHLWASATVFFFVGFVFAYFYLRSLNNGGMWHPSTSRRRSPSARSSPPASSGVQVPRGWRCAISAPAADRSGGRRPRSALALLVAAIGLQLAEWATQDFGPTQGGYASVYIGWTAMLFAFVVGTAFWLETVLATAIRYRALAVGEAPPPGHASGDPGRPGHDVADPLSLLVPQLIAVSFYTAFLAAIAVVTWIILYLV